MTRKIKRTICVFTGTRAEYGLLYPLISAIDKDKGLKLKLIVSGTHLAGATKDSYREIVSDGFGPGIKVKIPVYTETEEGLAEAIGEGIKLYTRALKKLRADIVVILGDRYEAFAMAAASMITGTVIAHIHGGEATYGLIDEALRHSITKMAHLHFTSTLSYRKKVIQLGEHPSRVFNVGALGVDNIKMTRLLSREEIGRKLGISFRSRIVLITFHPVTLERGLAVEQFNELIAALGSMKDTTFVFTFANADPEGIRINNLIKKYVKDNKDKAYVFPSLGRVRYLSLLREADLVIGNSSSGIIEAPCFNVPSVNIGSRQDGRIKARSVIDCEPDKYSIKGAIKKACAAKLGNKIRAMTNPYGSGNAAAKIKSVLRTADISSIRYKTFYSIKK